MNLVICAGSIPATLEPDGTGGHRVGLTHYPQNAAYCLDEARHLANAGHRVWITDGLNLAIPPPFHPDAVYAPCHLTGDHAAEIARRTNAPALIRVVAPLSGDIPRDAVRKNDYVGLLRATPVIATNSHKNAEVLRRWVQQAAASTEVFVIPHAIDPPPWAVALGLGEAVTMPNGERAEPNRTGAVYVGTNFQHKHVQRVIDACAAAGVPLCIVTSSPIDGSNGSVRLALNDTVTVLHHATDDVKWRALATARVCVTASENESYWMPGAEALSVGTPFAAPLTLELVRSVYDMGGGAANAGAGVGWHYDAAGLAQVLRLYCDPLTPGGIVPRPAACMATFKSLGMTPAAVVTAITAALTCLVKHHHADPRPTAPGGTT